jgi:hypothetical protein
MQVKPSGDCIGKYCAARDSPEGVNLMEAGTRSVKPFCSCLWKEML